MNVKPIKIKDFNLAPLMGVIFGGAGTDNDGAFDLPDELHGSLFGQMQDALNLKGHWPPSKEASEHLETLVDTIEHVEQKTGVKFSRNVVLMGGQNGHFAVDGNHNVQVDFSIASNQSPLSKDEIEAILFHEAGHIKNQDLEHQMGVGSWAGNLQFIASLSEFYKDEPDKFAHIIRDEFGGVAEFRAALDKVIAATNTALSGLESHHEYSTITDQRMLDLLTQKSDISPIMLGVSTPDADAMGDIIKLSMAFSMKSKKHQELMRKGAKAMGTPLDESYFSMLGATNYESSPAITTDEEKALDSINSEILLPSQKRYDSLIHFLGTYSRAAEYRADDVAVINATHPDVYPKSLDNIMLHAQNGATQASPEMLELQQMQPKVFVSHPDIPFRVDRANRLIRRIQTAERMCGVVDTDTAVLAVNKELSADANQTKAVDLPPH